MQRQLDLAADADPSACERRSGGQLATKSTDSGSRGTASNIASLPVLLDQFLRYIVDYRGCSPATATAYAHDCGRFIGFLERQGCSMDATAVTTREVRLFLLSLSHLNASSRRRTLYALRSFLNWLRDIEVLSANPASSIEPPKRDHKLAKAPSVTQCRLILEACQRSLEQAIIGFMLLAGLRRGEVLGLNVADVAADLSQLHVRGKGGGERAVPVSSTLRQILSDYLAERESDDPALIVSTGGARMGATQLYRVFRRILKRAGLSDSGITPHSLRHAFATNLIQAGVDIATMAELLGHSNIATTSVYLHSTTRSKQQAVEQLSFMAPTDGEGKRLGGGHGSSSGATAGAEKHPINEQEP